MSVRERQAALNHRLKAAQNEEASPGSSLRCECADLRCNATFELTEEERSLRRSHPGWFWVKPGHELATLERVVEECKRFSIVRIGTTPLYLASDGGAED